MYAPSVSGAERLSNGNTLVTVGTQGTFYEVNLSGDIVWKYINPVSKQGTLSQGDTIPDGNNAGTLSNIVFKARRYSPEHPAFVGKNLTPSTYIEQWTDNCPSQESIPWDSDGDGCIDDSDSDGVLDPNDACSGFDDRIDNDNDSVADGCDSFIDADNDGIEDSLDQCQGFDDMNDIDNDSIPDGCDSLLDNDGDGISNSLDECEGFDDAMDVDNDSIPDDCDTLLDNDGDGVANSEDECPGFDDLTDVNENQVPDGCDFVQDDLPSKSNDTSAGIQNSTDSTPVVESKNAVDKPFISVKNGLALTMIFLGLWMMFYLISSQLSQRRESKTDLFTDTAFQSVHSMIDLPSVLASDTPHVAPIINEIKTPQIPADGLPEGWTEQQWKYYGQQWIDARKKQ